MPQVVIQPSFGNPAARAHWKDTLDKKVPFSGPPYSPVLSARQLAQLSALHPGGRARFWGATSNQDAQIKRLRAGDVVLFTGRKLIQAVGEVGVTLQNAAFGDLMWSPHPDNGSYNNIYSLRGFEKVQIPYEEVWALPGFNEGDNFMGLRVLDPGKTDAILTGLRIGTITAAEPDAEELERLSRLAQRIGKVVDAEAFATASTSYERPGGTTYVNRWESLLIAAYRESLPVTQARPCGFPRASPTITQRGGRPRRMPDRRGEEQLQAPVRPPGAQPATRLRALQPEAGSAAGRAFPEIPQPGQCPAAARLWH